jgi:hypothetical protein
LNAEEGKGPGARRKSESAQFGPHYPILLNFQSAVIILQGRIAINGQARPGPPERAQFEPAGRDPWRERGLLE